MQKEALIILAIVQKLNPIIVLLDIQGTNLLF